MSGSAVTRAASLKSATIPDGVGVASGLTLTPVDRERVLPVLPALAKLLPWGGMRRGSTVAVRGSVTLLLALLAEATAGGSWAGVIGMPRLGVVAAAELGVEVTRLALVPSPGADLPAVAAALLDGMDLVVVAAGGRIAESQARRLSARARHRGAVLVPFGPWPGADLELSHVRSKWTGLEKGFGHLESRAFTVSVRGRGAAVRPSVASLEITGTGALVPAETPVVERVPRLSLVAG